MKNVLCTICAREGSKGIKNKNIIKLNNKHLIEYTIDIAKKIKFIDQIVISTDSNRIKKIAEKNKINVFFKRPKYLSTDKSSKIPVIKHALINSEKYFNTQFDYILDLDPTSPLRKLSDINTAFKKFLRSKSDILFSVCEARKNPYFNMVEKSNNEINIVKKHSNYNRRQDAPDVYEMNASIYLWKRKYLLSTNKLISNNSEIYVMPKERSIDIDEKFDLEIVKLIMKKNEK